MKKSKLITIGGVVIALGLCGYFFLGASSKERISWQTVKVSVVQCRIWCLQLEL